MSKKRLPNMNCKLGCKSGDKTMELGAYRDQVGNVSFGYWKCGQGFFDMSENLNYKNLKDLHKWLTKIIEYQERP